MLAEIGEGNKPHEQRKIRLKYKRKRQEYYDQRPTASEIYTAAMAIEEGDGNNDQQN